MAVVGVIPAAGHATRLQPLACSKEVYPVAGRPMMDHLLERMWSAPCDEIVVVTRPDKSDVAAHAEAHGASVVLGHPDSLGASLARGVAGLADDDVVLIGFPDSMWEPADGYAHVLGLLDGGWDVALGLFEVDRGELPRYEPVVTDGLDRVLDIQFKPDRPASPWIWGCAATRAGVLRDLDVWGEPGHLFRAVAGHGRVGAVRLGGYVDMGTPSGLRAALRGRWARAGQPPVLLGSGGWMPTSSRATCSMLLRRQGHALLIDAGTGVSRLVEDPSLLLGVETLDIVLSHFHLDHVTGLAYLPGLALRERPRIHGPGAWLYGAPTREIIARLTGSPLFALGVDDLFTSVEELRPDGLRSGPFEIALREQRRHDDPTVAFRVDNEVAYCTDTAYDPGNAGFADGCEILFHEAWCTDAQRVSTATHSSGREAGEIASAAGAGALVLIHVRPGIDEHALEADARATFANAVVGEDLAPIAPAPAATAAVG